MKKTLENIVNIGKNIGNSIKKHAKKAVAGGITMAMFAVPTYSGKLNLNTYVGYGTGHENGAQVKIHHTVGASESFDFYDAELIDRIPSIVAYSKIPNYELIKDSRDSNSTTTYKSNFEKTGSSVFGIEEMSFEIVDMNDFDWKNIFAERYGKDGDSSNPNDILKTWDVKYNEGSWFATGGVSASNPGVYDKIKIKFFNHTDLNRDEIVGNLDRIILNNEFGNSGSRFGENVGADVNDLGAYADINRDGIVNQDDKDIFNDECQICGCPCIGDLNDNGNRTLGDLDAMVNVLLGAGPPFIAPVNANNVCADFDDNGYVSLADLDAMVNLLLNAGPPFIAPCK